MSITYILFVTYSTVLTIGTVSIFYKPTKVTDLKAISAREKSDLTALPLGSIGPFTWALRAERRTDDRRLPNNPSSSTWPGCEADDRHTTCTYVSTLCHSTPTQASLQILTSSLAMYSYSRQKFCLKTSKAIFLGQIRITSASKLNDMDPLPWSLNSRRVRSTNCNCTRKGNELLQWQYKNVLHKNTY